MFHKSQSLGCECRCQCLGHFSFPIRTESLRFQRVLVVISPWECYLSPVSSLFFFFESSCLLIEDSPLLFMCDRPFTIEMKVAIAKENLSIIFHFVSGGCGALLFLSLVSWQCVAKIDSTTDHRSIVTWFALTSQRETETLLRQDRVSNRGQLVPISQFVTSLSMPGTIRKHPTQNKLQ